MSNNIGAAPEQEMPSGEMIDSEPQKEPEEMPSGEMIDSEPQKEQEEMPQGEME